MTFQFSETRSRTWRGWTRCSSRRWREWRPSLILSRLVVHGLTSHFTVTAAATEDSVLGRNQVGYEASCSSGIALQERHVGLAILRFIFKLLLFHVISYCCRADLEKSVEKNPDPATSQTVMTLNELNSRLAQGTINAAIRMQLGVFICWIPITDSSDELDNATAKERARKKRTLMRDAAEMLQEGVT